MRVDATALRREAQTAADEIARNPDVRDHVAHDALDELGASAKHMGAPGLVVAALDDERRQTQRRMIAALYWQLGEAYLEADRFFAGSRPWERRMDAAAPILNAARRMHRAMEAAL